MERFETDVLASQWPLPWIAYAFATIKHETGDTFRPIYEKGSRAYFRKYDVEYNPRKAKALGNTQKGDGYTYRGRGYVQLTGRKNYALFGLADDPDKALEPETAFHILVRGMKEGLFTGKELGDYLTPPPGNPSFSAALIHYKNARRIINGTDKAELIAGYAQKFEHILRSAAHGTPAKAPDTSQPEGTVVPPTVPSKSFGERVKVVTSGVREWFGEINAVDTAIRPVSKASWLKTAFTAVIGFFQLAYAFATENWIYVLGGTALVIAALWYISRSKDRGVVRAK